MIYKVLAAELSSLGVAWVVPGIVETDMLHQALRNDPSFGEVVNEKFVSLDLLKKFIGFILAQRPAEFSKEWNIYDSSHHHFWLDASEQLPSFTH